MLASIKKLIGIIFVSSMLCNIGFAEMRTNEERQFWFGGNMETNVATTCIDGYKFVIVRGVRAVSIVQVYEVRDGKSIPAKC